MISELREARQTLGKMLDYSYAVKNETIQQQWRKEIELVNQTIDYLLRELGLEDKS